MEEIKYYDDYCSVRAFTSFCEKVYIDCGNVMRAAYLMRVEYLLAKNNNEEKPKAKMYFNAAGLGEYAVNNTRCVCSSPESVGIHSKVNAFKSGEKVLKWKHFYVRDLLSSAFDGVVEVCDVKCRYSPNYHCVYRWKWNGIKPEKVYLDFSKIILTEDGWTTDAVIPENTFPTADECKDANKVSVIEFDD